MRAAVRTEGGTIYKITFPYDFIHLGVYTTVKETIIIFVLTTSIKL